MAVAIGPVSVVPGLPATLGPFTPPVGSTRHDLSLGAGAWAGTLMTVLCEISRDSGGSYLPLFGITYAGPVSAWTRNGSGAIAPSVSQVPPADAATRIRYTVSVVDGALASAGGSYTGSP